MMAGHALFHPDCPYDARPMFRLKEQFEDKKVFVGDSSGGHAWIDGTKPLRCPETCECYSLIIQREEDTFCFSVEKTPTTMRVQINSPQLAHWVSQAMGSVHNTLNSAHAYDGLLLLKNRPRLVDAFSKFYTESPLERAEIDLLVNGLLNDPDVFKSYGHHNLLVQGDLNTLQWEEFQSPVLNRDIDALKWVWPPIDHDQLLHTNSQVDQLEIFTSLAQPMNENVFHDLSYSTSPESDLSEREIPGDNRGNQSPKPGQPSEVIQPLKFYSPNSSKPTFPTPAAMGMDSMMAEETNISLRADPGTKADDYQVYNIIDSILAHFNWASNPAPLWVRFSAISDDIYLNDVWAADFNRLQQQQTTALINGARTGRHDIVVQVIQQGADVNHICGADTALTIAAQHSSDSILHLLLENGADIQLAMVLLQDECPNSIRSKAMMRLATVSRRLEKEAISSTMEKKRLIIYRLRIEFSKEYSHMKNNLGWAISRPWYQFFRSFSIRKAWEFGCDTLRNLCNQTLPANVNEALMILCMSKSMSCVLDNKHFWDLEREFKQDLGRWLRVFDHDPQAQYDFRDAVRGIWGVDVSSPRHNPMPKIEVLRYFQTMALNLVGKTKQALGLESVFYDRGLIYIQERWKEAKNPLQEVDNSQRDSFTDNPRPPDPPEAGHFIEIQQRELPYQSSNSGHLATDSAPHLRNLTMSENILTIIMAGAIFAIILYFLQYITTGYNDALPTEAWMGRHQRALLNGVISILLSPSNDTPNLPAAFVESMKQHLENAVCCGLILSLSSMYDYLATACKFQAPEFGKYLLSRYWDLQETFSLQRSFMLMQSLIGFGSGGTVLNPSCHCMKPFRTEEGGQEMHDRENKSESAETIASRSARGPTSWHPIVSVDGMTVPSSSSTSAPSPVQQEKITFCQECNHEFRNTSNYNRHRKCSKHKNKRYYCSFENCPNSYSRNEKCLNHEKTHRALQFSRPP